MNPKAKGESEGCETSKGDFVWKPEDPRSPKGNMCEFVPGLT